MGIAQKNKLLACFESLLSILEIVMKLDIPNEVTPRKIGAAVSRRKLSMAEAISLISEGSCVKSSYHWIILNWNEFELNCSKWWLDNFTVKSGPFYPFLSGRIFEFLRTSSSSQMRSDPGIKTSQLDRKTVPWKGMTFYFFDNQTKKIYYLYEIPRNALKDSITRLSYLNQ